MNRREFCSAMPLLLAGCGSGDPEVEFELQQSPRVQTARLGSYVNIIEGDWTPTLTFTVPGDVSVTYGSRTGKYRRDRDLIEVAFTIVTTAFTHSTGGGIVIIDGLPYDCGQSSQKYLGHSSWSGVTKAGFTQLTPDVIWGGSFIYFWCSGSGVAMTSLAPADVPSGGTVILEGSAKYLTTAAGSGYSAA